MSKPIIGVISNRNINEEGRTFQNTTNFSSLVCESIYNMGGIPIGIFFPNNKFDIDLLKLCDGFVFQGGSKIETSQILAANYAVSNRIPLLGICNGMQTLAGEDYALQSLKYITPDNLKLLIKNEEHFLYKVDNHNKNNPFYIQNIEGCKHNINISKYSRLYDLIREKNKLVTSVHEYAVKDELLHNSSDFFVSARSDDGVIEAIETRDPNYFCLGVQYHPELDYTDNVLFINLVNESRKQKVLKR